MQETIWQPLPYPFTLTAAPQVLPRLDSACVIERLLEDTAGGVAGVLAAATLREETVFDEIRYTARLPAEHLKTTVVLWRQWREQEGGAGAEGYTARVPRHKPRGRERISCYRRISTGGGGTDDP